MTDNAIRGHLLALERDGLIRQGERRRTGGKPSYTYQLTAEGERLFPKAYGELLGQLLAVLQARLSSDQMESLLEELGHRLAPSNGALAGGMKDRVEGAQRLLASMGGLSEIEVTSDGYRIAGLSCPLAAAVDGTPDACLIAATLLRDLTGAPVRQMCDIGPPPHCRFEIVVSDQP